MAFWARNSWAEAWTRRGLPGRYLPVEKHDHFSILEELARRDGKLFGVLQQLAGNTADVR